MQCKVVKVPKGAKAAAPKAKMKVGDPQPGGFEYHVGEDGSVTIFGTRANGDQVDISDVATLSVVSGDTSAITVSTPVGMSFVESAVAVGHSDVASTATWNDGSIGPFTISEHCDVLAAPPGPVTGLIIVHGPVTVR